MKAADLVAINCSLTLFYLADLGLQRGIYLTQSLVTLPIPLSPSIFNFCLMICIESAITVGI